MIVVRVFSMYNHHFVSLYKKTSCVGDRIFCVFFRQKQQQAFVIIQDLSEQCQHNKAPNGRCFMNWGRETNIKLKPLNLDLSEVSNFAFFFKTKAKDRSSKGDKRSISVKVSQGEEQQLSRQWIQLMNKPMFCVQHLGYFLSKC